MGWMDAISNMFGAGKPPQTTQTSTIKLSPEQESIFKSAFPYIQDYASKPLQQFSGTGIAGFSPEELQAQQEYLRQAGGNMSSLADRAAETNKMMMDPNFMLNMNNPALTAARDAVTQGTTRDFLQNVLPNVEKQNIAGGGMYSGGASKGAQAAGLATGNTGAALSENLSKMMYDAYNRGLTGMQGAIGQNPSVMSGLLQPANAEASVGAQNRALQQAQLDETIRKFYTGQMLPFMQGQELMQLLQGMPGGTTTSTGTGAVPQGSAGQSLGGLGMLMGGMNSMFPSLGGAISGGLGSLASGAGGLLSGAGGALGAGGAGLMEAIAPFLAMI